MGGVRPPPTPPPPPGDAELLSKTLAVGAGQASTRSTEGDACPPLQAPSHALHSTNPQHEPTTPRCTHTTNAPEIHNIQTPIARYQ